MYEVWYVSCHGFGHITRSLAQLEKKLDENSNFKCIIISGEKQIEFAKLYFKDYSDRVIFRKTLTDVGLINKNNNLDVDKELLEIKLKDFISCRKSAQLDEITVANFNGTVFTTSGMKVKNIDGKVVELSEDILDTQNYIATSNFIIAKAGWGTVAEAVCAKTPMILLEREGVLEDTHIITAVKEKFNAISINLEDLKRINYEELRLQMT